MIDETLFNNQYQRSCSEITEKSLDIFKPARFEVLCAVQQLLREVCAVVLEQAMPPPLPSRSEVTGVKKIVLALIYISSHKYMCLGPHQSHPFTSILHFHLLHALSDSTMIPFFHLPSSPSNSFVRVYFLVSTPISPPFSVYFNLFRTFISNICLQPDYNTSS